MKMLRVKTCCCGCSLRTGTILILLTNAVTVVAGLFVSSGGILVLGIIVLALIGVFLKSPWCLVPYMIIQWLSLVACVIVIIGIFLQSEEEWRKFLENHQPSFWKAARQTGKEKESVQTFRNIAIPLIEVGAIVTMILYTYFAIVVWSFYKEMKENKADSS